MAVKSHTISLSTRGSCDTRDITPELTRLVADSRITHGTVTVFCPGSTGGLTTIEFEPGVVGDLAECFDRLAPQDLHYAHDAAWGDGNGHSHVRASLLGPSITVPIVDGSMTLGTWQQVVFIDFDNRPRDRRLVVQIVGE